MHQDHDFALPLVGSERVIRIDVQTDELLSDSPKSLRHEGSFSSVLTIRCNGTRVSVTGNPSRWNRADNLFGFTTISECVAVYNNMLLAHGLPPFTPSAHSSYRQGEDGKRAELISDGAVIDHIDITRNLAVGAGSERAYLRGLSTLSLGKGKEPYLYPNNKTVDWYKGSTVKYIKVYDKAHDLRKHQSKRLREASEKEKAHYESVIDYCQSVGLVREEHSFKSPWLKRNNLNSYGRVELVDYIKHTTILGDAMKRLEVIDTKFEDIAEQLLNAKVVGSTQSANATQAVAHLWMYGRPVDKKKRQYYEHRKRLLEIGIDISMPFDASRVIPQIRSTQVVDVLPVAPPSWYQMPESPKFLALA